MSVLGRPPKGRPKTLWNYRHMKLLVDALANYGDDASYLEIALEFLATSWNVPVIKRGHDERIDHVELIQALAKHCLEHGRADE